MKSTHIRRGMVLLAVILIGSFNLVSFQVARASTLTVCPSGCGYTSVAAAVAAANANDTITVGAGTYFENSIDISKNLTLTGAGSTLVIINAQNAGRIFEIDSGKTVSISGVTLKNGRITATDDDGGAIFSQGNLTLKDTKFLNNHTDDMGGAIFSEGGNLTISNSLFDGNNNNTARSTGASGGAIASASIGNLSLEKVTLTNNTAKYGGAIAILEYGHTAGKIFTLNNSTVANNTATEQGGGIFDSQIDTTITNSVFNGNHANNSFGGGLYFHDIASTLTLQNVTVSNNQGLNGGGIYLGQAASATFNSITVTLNNSTDVSGDGGGGIYAIPANTLNIKNSIIAGNTDNLGGNDSPDCNFIAVSIVYSLIKDTTNCSGTTTSNNLLAGTDPKLDPLADYGGLTFTHRLHSGSPAIDAADNATCLATDQRGVLRPKDGNSDNVATCDMGAYEVRLNQTATLSSIASQDGWVLESSETSGVGATINAAATTFNLGDDVTRKQYRSILSFNTSNLPDNAVIVAVTLKVKKSSIVGSGNPVTIFQGFKADIKKGMFGGNASLQTGDFQAAANKTYGPFTPSLVSGWYTINLTSAKAYINKLSTGGGLTQIRLRFKLDDNNDAQANILKLYSGNATAANRPQLVIVYYVP